MAEKEPRSAQGDVVERRYREAVGTAAAVTRGPMRPWRLALAATLVFGALLSSGCGQKTVQPSAEEQKYIGRFLPAGYEEAKVAEPGIYATTVPMSNTTVSQSETEISIPLADAVSKKIVYFEYARSGSEPIPMIAYVKPSGKLFVGVSYCAPCQGKGQRLESDGTLTCETCNTKRDPESEAGISGACKRYPLDELPVKVVGEKIVLAKAAIDAWTPQPLDRPTGD